MRLTSRWLNSAGDIPDDAWRKCFSPRVEGKWWYETLEKSGLEDQFTFGYLVIESGPEIVAIAPTFVMDVPIDLVAPPTIAKILRTAGAIIRRLRYQRTLFIGSPCSDEGTLGLASNAARSEVVAFVQDVCMKRGKEIGASIVVWKDFSPDLNEQFDELIVKRGVFRIVSYPGTVAKFPAGGGDYEQYLAALSSPHRHNLKKKIRKGAEVGRLISSVVQHPNAETLKEIFALFWQTYEHGKMKFETLTPAFFSEIAKLDHAHFILMRHADSNKLAAFMLCFHLDDVLINKFIGLDYTLGDKWFLYFRLWEQAVRFAMSIRAKEIQSGQTGYRAKLDVGHQLYPLNNFARHRNGLLNRLFAKIAGKVKWTDLDSDLKIYLTAHPEAAASNSGPAAQRGQ